MILVKLTLILIISIFKYQWRLVESQILPLYGKTWVSKNPLFHIFYANLKSTNSVIIETVLPQSMFYLKNKKTWFVWSTIRNNLYTNQPAFTCSKLTIKPLEQGVKYVQTTGAVLVSLLLTLNIFHTLFYCFYCSLWTCNCRLCSEVVYSQKISFDYKTLHKKWSFLLRISSFFVQQNWEVFWTMSTFIP